MKEVLQHELAAVPPSLFNDDLSMRKTKKCDLSKKLESLCAEIYHLPNGEEKTAYIVDGMAIL